MIETSFVSCKHAMSEIQIELFLHKIQIELELIRRIDSSTLTEPSLVQKHAQIMIETLWFDILFVFISACVTFLVVS